MVYAGSLFLAKIFLFPRIVGGEEHYGIMIWTPER